MGGGHTAWLRHREPLEKVWRIADAKGQVLGRLATQLSNILQGKHKPTRLDNIFCGDPIVVINARHFELTGRKKWNKEYIHHTGYPGGLKRVPIHELMDKRPEDALRLAIRRMLPSNKLRQVRLNNLYIFPDEDHPYAHHKPVPIPPAHAGARLGKGGAPTMFELENWWLTHLSECPDAILDEVMSESYEETRKAPIGLAEALQFGEDEAASAEDRAVLQESFTINPATCILDNIRYEKRLYTAKTGAVRLGSEARSLWLGTKDTSAASPEKIVHRS